MLHGTSRRGISFGGGVKAGIMQPVDDRFISVQSLRNRLQTAVQTRNLLEEVLNVRVTERTVRRRLYEDGLKSYVPAKAPKLEVCHRVARLAFARQHRNWSEE
ncbi:hypothetical protein B5X24_HaOG208763 [Helicoverpa armigera]|uniref:Transposase Tc1-like domain-containing protein n=1 Tax=Helicoverpa armigera TaxID=29058 RepID=A0A2W1BG73_HELAM|nr:hypothetical protein B5X24_HaOG208763 [Helicoverpa armigera]